MLGALRRRENNDTHPIRNQPCLPALDDYKTNSHSYIGVALITFTAAISRSNSAVERDVLRCGENPMTEPVTRRRFIAIGALATSGMSFIGLADAAPKTYRGAMPVTPATPPNPVPNTGAVSEASYLFLSNEEKVFVEAAVARLIPADALGPGALEAGCALFIDRQLAGAYGRADHWYMQGPWPEGNEQQGLQSRMSPAATYRAGIRAVNNYCRAHFTGKAFNELAPNEQDQLLAALEKGEPELQGVKAKSFFAMLLQNTIEGFFADPLYGGNRDMVGWKLIGFPGARYDHRNVVDKHGEPYILPPVSIMGRKEWS